MRVELAHHKALISWVRLQEKRIPALGLLIHIPNGEKRDKATAGRLKAMGVRAGVWDLFLPCPIARTPGLWIELKSSSGRLSKAQDEWGDEMRKQGYTLCVARSWEEARDVILQYLGHNT